jgi:hypothetical protein
VHYLACALPTELIQRNCDATCNAHAGSGRPPAALRRSPSLHDTISHNDSLDLLSIATGIQGNSIVVTGSNTVLMQPVAVRGSVLSQRRTSSAPDVHTTTVAAVRIVSASNVPVRRRSLQQHARRHRHSLDTTEQQQQQQQLELQAFTLRAQVPRHSVTVNGETAEVVTAVESDMLPPLPDGNSSGNERHTELVVAVDNSSSRSSDASTRQIGRRSSSSTNSGISTAHSVATSPVKLMHSGRLKQGRLLVVAPVSSTATATLLPAIGTADTAGNTTAADGLVEQRCNRTSTK